MKYLIGLGNPGDKYVATRHNIGRECLGALAAKGDYSDLTYHKPAQALRARGMLAGEMVELVQPETFMNKSGETVRFLMEKEGAALADIIVLHDEVDMALGELKLSIGRGAGGNNGVQSIIDHVGSKEFLRVRIGIASRSWWSGEAKRPEAGRPLNSFVMGSFSLFERPKLPDVYSHVHDVLSVLITEGATAAMNKYN